MAVIILCHLLPLSISVQYLSSLFAYLSCNIFPFWFFGDEIWIFHGRTGKIVKSKFHNFIQVMIKYDGQQNNQVAHEFLPSILKSSGPCFLGPTDNSHSFFPGDRIARRWSSPRRFFKWNWRTVWETTMGCKSSKSPSWNTWFSTQNQGKKVKS